MTAANCHESAQVTRKEIGETSDTKCHRRAQGLGCQYSPFDRPSNSVPRSAHQLGSQEPTCRYRKRFDSDAALPGLTCGREGSRTDDNLQSLWLRRRRACCDRPVPPIFFFFSSRISFLAQGHESRPLFSFAQCGERYVGVRLSIQWAKTRCIIEVLLLVLHRYRPLRDALAIDVSPAPRRL